MFGSDFDDDDFDHPDTDFDLSNNDLDKPKQSAHIVPFKVFEPADIQKQQDDMIAEVNMILNMSKEDAIISYCCF